jgi:hypothetical protein
VTGGRVRGTSIFSEGDDLAFRVSERPDEVLARVEAAAPGQFIAFEGVFSHNETGEETTRTLYVRADRVWAVSPWLAAADDE